MSAPAYSRSLVCLTKRLKLSSRHSPVVSSQQRCLHQTQRHRQSSTQSAVQSETADLQPVESLSPAELEQELQRIRLPRAVQATYLTPLRRTPTHGIKVCDLQLRSYSVRNLELFADFALRAAYYLNLPAKGPVPLPRITERWTVPRSNFVHKKSQENFERITLRRLVQIQDGHPEVVSMWLGFLQKYRYYGIGMKANVFEHGSLQSAGETEASFTQAQERLQQQFELMRSPAGFQHDKHKQKLEKMLHDDPFKGAWGAHAAMASAVSVSHSNSRFETQTVESEEFRRRREQLEKDKLAQKHSANESSVGEENRKGRKSENSEADEPK